jgi:hypothetical protein
MVAHHLRLPENFKSLTLALQDLQITHLFLTLLICQRLRFNLSDGLGLSAVVEHNQQHHRRNDNQNKNCHIILYFSY